MKKSGADSAHIATSFAGRHYNFRCRATGGSCRAPTPSKAGCGCAIRRMAGRGILRNVAACSSCAFSSHSFSLSLGFAAILWTQTGPFAWIGGLQLALTGSYSVNLTLFLTLGDLLIPAVRLLSFRRQKNEWRSARGPVLAQRANDFISVGFGHHDIAENKVRQVFFRSGDDLAAHAHPPEFAPAGGAVVRPRRPGGTASGHRRRMVSG